MIEKEADRGNKVLRLISAREVVLIERPDKGETASTLGRYLQTQEFQQLLEEDRTLQRAVSDALDQIRARGEKEKS